MRYKTRVTKARIAAEQDAAVEVTSWYSEESAKLDAADLSAIERAAAKHDLFMEMGRRSKVALSRAKRQTSLPKLLENEARAAIEAERAEKRRGWIG